jgi:hypothetical protein
MITGIRSHLINIDMMSTKATEQHWFTRFHMERVARFLLDVLSPTHLERANSKMVLMDRTHPKDSEPIDSPTTNKREHHWRKTTEQFYPCSVENRCNWFDWRSYQKLTIYIGGYRQFTSPPQTNEWIWKEFSRTKRYWTAERLLPLTDESTVPSKRKSRQGAEYGTEVIDDSCYSSKRIQYPRVLAMYEPSAKVYQLEQASRHDQSNNFLEWEASIILTNVLISIIASSSIGSHKAETL